MIIPGKAQRVLLFHQGDKSMGKLLGNKGAQLAQMSCLGLPVPPGFTITTQVSSQIFFLVVSYSEHYFNENISPPK
jgi:hypothetical protein